MAVKQTIVECLTVLGINLEHFQNAESVEQEFTAIKKVYFKRVLVAHPDKGGDAAVFREIHTNWEVLRDLYDKGKVHAKGFGHYFSQEGSKQETENRESHAKAFDGRPTPSWEWFAEASGEPVPTYRVEIAKSGRSACNQKAQSAKGNDNKHCHHTSELIEKDEIRFGSMEEMSGSYGRWYHMRCWRVPSKVWLGLPDPTKCRDPAQFHNAVMAMQQIIFCGYNELSAENQRLVVEYLMDPSHYAALRTSKAKDYAASVLNPDQHLAKQSMNVGTAASASAPSSSSSSSSSSWSPAGDNGSMSAGSSSNANANANANAFSSVALVNRPSTSSSTALSTGGYRFEMPRPGLNGAEPNQFANKTFVLTGIFPEAGGGMGLNLGKDRVKFMIESFGGRVTGSVSGKTDYLVVGKEPGAGKTGQAESRGVQQVDLKALKIKLETPGGRLEDAPQVMITEYSRGYGSNGIALKIGLPVAPPKFAKQLMTKPKKAAPPTKTKAKAKGKGKGKRKRDEDSEPEPGEHVFDIFERFLRHKRDEPSDDGDSYEQEQEQEAELPSHTQSQPEYTTTITCDLCSVDCSAQSWLVDEERDMCQDCYDDADEAEVADAVLCENGEPVKSGKAKTKAKAKAKAKPKAQAKAKPNAKAKAKGIAPSKSVKKVKAIAN